MSAQPTILLLDDDQDFLDLYREMLGQHLPSMPEVRIANSGARALSILESEQFNLLIAVFEFIANDLNSFLNVFGHLNGVRARLAKNVH